MFFGLNAFICRFAIVLQALSLSAIFFLSGYNPYVRTQTAGFLAGLRILIAGLPILALVIGFAIFFSYPLAGKNLKEMRTKLKELHRQKGLI
jgi:GPH family glycoside/pentoside/hexuronide:cation symporter